MTDTARHRPRIPRTALYAAAGFAFGASLTACGYLFDYHHLYGELPDWPSVGLLAGLHSITPVHYFADLFALILAVAAGVTGWLQDRVLFYSSRLEDLVQERTSELSRSEQRHTLALAGSNDGIWEWDLNEDRLYLSPRWKTMLGFAEEEIGDRPAEWLDRVHPEDSERVREGIREHLAQGASHLRLEYRMQHRDGTWRWMLARGACLRDSDGKPLRIAGSQADIHELRLNEEQLRHLALHDELTDLPNRAVLMDRLERQLHRAHRTRTRIAVLHVGADRFRRINESLGSTVGDRLLRELARLLVLQVSERGASDPGLESGGTVYRFQGDEFVIVLEKMRSLRDAAGLAERILQTLGRPIQVDGHSVRFGASVGIAVGPHDSSDAASLLRDAHMAMNRAKQRGGSRVEVYDRNMHETAQAELHLETELFRALEDGQLQVWYQPVVSLRSERITGFEALVRWDHPIRGAVPPDEFIPLAEESGLIARMSRHTFRVAMMQLRRWQEMFEKRKDLAIKMNVSPRWLFDDHMESDLDHLLADTGADPSRIHLEITESCLIERPDDVAGSLHRLRARGFRIALDDFGTGYSSLSILHRLPFDLLKLDKSFISRLPRQPALETVAGSIIALARKLSMDVVAEGIETRAQLLKLRALRCGYGQGYLFGRPMRAQDAESLMRAADTGLSRSLAAAR
ncbi:MAG: putative bifunctional diguanylate cyclase/phosphodiesterase [Candidatus Polarisedimenticolia bacterium]